MTGPEGPQGPQGDEGPQGPQGEKEKVPTKFGSMRGIWVQKRIFWIPCRDPAGEDGMLPEGTDIGNTTFWDGTEWVVDNSNLYHDSLRVGIGIDTPSALFHTQGLDSAGGNVVFEGEFKFQTPDLLLLKVQEHA